MNFEVVQGDIAEQSADALVNAAGTSLRMGSGVAGALRRVAGDELDETARSEGPIDLGDVAITSAYALNARYVIHAAAMPHYGDGKATEASIRDATYNALAAADDVGCRSVVVPALGCGVAGFPLAVGAEIICEELVAFKPKTLDVARFVAYTDEEFRTIRSVADRVRSG